MVAMLDPVMEELKQQLAELERGFFTQLRKIAEQRQGVQRSFSSDPKSVNVLDEKDQIGNVQTFQATTKSFPVRLEPTLLQKLATARTKADELEDQQQVLRTTFEDKMQTISRKKNELNRREKLLLNSVQQIELYLRAVFYLKKNADVMQKELRENVQVLSSELKELRLEILTLKQRKEPLQKLVTGCQPVKDVLEAFASQTPRFSNADELVKYYLALEMLQMDMTQEADLCLEAENRLRTQRKDLTLRKRWFPIDCAEKRRKVIALCEAAERTREEIAKLKDTIYNENMDKVKEDMQHFKLLQWIKYLYQKTCHLRPPRMDNQTLDTMEQLEVVQNFFIDGYEVLKKLGR